MTATLPCVEELHRAYEQAALAYNAGRWPAALEYIESFLAGAPDHAEALHLRGLIALALGHTIAARSWIERALQAQPHPAFHHSLAVTQIKLRAYVEAADSAHQGLDLAHRSMPAFDVSPLVFSLGLALQLNGELNEAMHHYRHVIELRPEHSEAHNNLGIILKALGELESAIKHHQQAVTLDSNNRQAHSNLGHALLAAGRYQAAWPHHEYRWASFQDLQGNQDLAPPDVPLPQWQGQTLPVGRNRLLVLPEQGLGDSLQFCRYLPLALAHFAVVGFICPPPLRRLLEDSLCRQWPQVVLLDEPPSNWQDWEWYSALLSLPMAFGTQVPTIPNALPYLYADPSAAEIWQARLVELGPPSVPRVGVVWAGGHSGWSNDRQRSLTPEQIATLLAWPHVYWISLQKTDDPAKRLTPAQRSRMLDWSGELTDFADTAALIEHLDLVISVDTSVAHLAAAMGKRVWLLNRFAGCWRWLRNRDDSPWYPGMRLFTQTQADDWSEVLARVVAALEQEYEAQLGV